MQKIAFYRKYRPKTFKQVSGQKLIIKTLLNSIKYNKLSHAYIFSGPKGTGKTSIAKIFAKAINCTHNIDGDACDTCDICKAFNNNELQDIVELDAASNSGVDDVRNIIDTCGYMPIELKKKIYIIDEAHMLSTSA
jgi:DNA polymerase-3 subunit gamma/tau